MAIGQNTFDNVERERERAIKFINLNLHILGLPMLTCTFIGSIFTCIQLY